MVTGKILSWAELLVWHKLGTYRAQAPEKKEG